MKKRQPGKRYSSNTIENIIARLEISEHDWCWEWLGSPDTRGYGQVRFAGRGRRVHKLIFEHFVGSVPVGFELDHTCRNRRCANPLHLEVVTRQENVRRGNSPAAKHAKKTHCPAGHPYEGDNLRMRKGRRDCVACEKLRIRVRKQLKGIARGERVKSSKLTELQVIGIMARYLQGASQYQIAREYGVVRPTIQHIVNGKTWKYLFEEEGRGYRLYHSEEGALGERMEDGTHRFVCQVDGEINGRVYRTIREAKAECLRRFGRKAVRAF